jgi:hypothetical protein
MGSTEKLAGQAHRQYWENVRKGQLVLQRHRLDLEQAGRMDQPGQGKQKNKKRGRLGKRQFREIGMVAKQLGKGCTKNQEG